MVGSGSVCGLDGMFVWPPKNLNRKWLYQCVSRDGSEFVMLENCAILEWPGTTVGFRTVGKWCQDENSTCHALWDCLRSCLLSGFWNTCLSSS